MSGTAARSGYASVRSNDQESDSDSSDEERTHCAQQLAEGKIGDGDSYAGDVGGVYLPGHSRRSQSTYLACCCGINVGVYFLYHAVPSTATLLRREFAFSAVQIGTLQSMYSLPTLGVVFCSGIVVDRIGLWSSCLIFASVVLVASIIWCTALTVLSSSSTIFAFGICAQGFLGTGGESLFVAQKALLGATFGAHGDNDSTAAVGCQVKTGFAFGASQTAAKLAQAAALWIMPPVATKFGLIAAFTFASGVCFLALVCCACGFSMERTRLSTGPKTSAAATSSSGVSTSRLVPHDDDQCENGKDAGRGKCSELPCAFWMLICCIACGSLVSSSMDALYTDALVERFGYSIEFAGRVSSMQFALSAAGAPIVGAYLDRRGKLASTLMIGSGLECIALCCLLLSVAPEVQATLQGLAKVLSNGALWPAVARLMPVSRYGCAFGVVVLGQNAAMTVGPPIAGILRDTTGDYGAVLVMWASVAFVGALLATGLLYDDGRGGGGKLERPEA